ncbi:MAG TPA: dienelactone hydrolase family protein [Gemmatimonadales bacterium]|nr:dienelactone hydrolase family protein [Gemmatimonadales bacterium]
MASKTGGAMMERWSGAGWKWGLAGALFLSILPAFHRTPADLHSEYVKYASGKDSITAYLVYPERRDPAPAVIVIHEIFGLTPWVRSMADSLATAGYVAIVPDLLSRRGGTPATDDSSRKLIMTLPPDSVTADLDATAGYLKSLKAVRADRLGVIGFCWGGGQSFRYATNNAALRAFVVCYGPSPDTATVARVKAKGLGFYGENDARIDAGLPDLAAAVRRHAVDYRYTVYPGVGHGFFRTRENPAVADSAWRAVVSFFRAQLGK